MGVSKEQVAVITGATAGIGLATAIALSKRGFVVYGTGRRPSEALQNSVVMLACDITSDTSVAGVVAGILRRHGRIDVLVNNAGYGLIGAAEESSIEQAKDIFDVNVFGLMRVTNAILPAMRKQGSGRVINISSVLGFIPAPYNAIYGATKHAIEGYSQSLDHEVRDFGIRVISIEPAVTRTSFEKNLVKPDRPLASYDTVRNAVIAASAQMIAEGDAPEVVAQVVVKAALDTKPQMRYTAGPAARKLSILRRFVPETLFNKSLRKQFGLPS